jgi:hypothetical protein
MSDESIKSAYKKAAKGTGGVLVAEHFKSGGGFFGGGMTEEEITGLEEIGKTTSGAMKLATEAFQKSSVDYATYSETLKKIGVSESDRFGAYVDNFGRKIDEMNGKKPSADKYIMNNEATKQQAEWMNKVAGNNAPDTNQKTDTGIGASVGNALRDAWKRNFL